MAAFTRFVISIDLQLKNILHDLHQMNDTEVDTMLKLNEENSALGLTSPLVSFLSYTILEPALIYDKTNNIFSSRLDFEVILADFYSDTSKWHSYAEIIWDRGLDVYARYRPTPSPGIKRSLLFSLPETVFYPFFSKGVDLAVHEDNMHGKGWKSGDDTVADYEHRYARIYVRAI